MNYLNIFKRQTKLIVYVIIGLTIIVMGSSYALFFRVRKNTNNQIVQAGALEIEYSQQIGLTVNEDDPNNCLIPRSDDTGACTFEFTIKNKGNLSSTYNIYIYNDSTGLTNPVFVDHAYIKHTLRKQIVGETISTPVNEAMYLNNDKLVLKDGKRLLDSNIIGVGQEIKFTLKIWIDEEVPEDIIGKNVQLSIDVDNNVDEQINAQQILLSSMDESGLYEVTNISALYGINDTNYVEYRYMGTNPNNYVYFNCTNEANVNTCEKWRILGIYNVPFNNGYETRIKLINLNSTILKEWDNSSRTDFTVSTIIQYLNGEYLYSLSQTAKNKIVNSQFNLNGPDNLLISGNEIFLSEQASDDIVSTKVGLISLSDYALASGNNTNLNDTAKLKSSWLFQNAEWLINKNTNNEIYAINASGAIETSNTNTKKLVRPVIYLNSNVKIVDGNGTFENPYVLQ